MFQNRHQAGFLLAKKLQQYKSARDTIICAIPRGGVVVGHALAQKLNLPLSAIIVKKIGSPGNPELAAGALSSSGEAVWDEEVLFHIGGLSKEAKAQLLEEKKHEVKKREEELGIRKALYKNKTVILVDDGVATGSTVLSAALTIQREKIDTLILAVPVISKEILEKLQKHFDKIIALEVPKELNAVGEFYEEFSQVEDEEVRVLLRK